MANGNGNGNGWMTQQNKQLAAQILSIVGMLATSFGWLTAEQVAGLTTSLMAAVGPLMTLVGFVWALITSRQKNVVAAAAQVPGVHKIELENNAEGHELSDGTPDNVSVPPTKTL